MADSLLQSSDPVQFETHPDRYRHIKLSTDGAIARISLDVVEDAPLRPGYQLKLNSYDLGVDIELADAVQRLRFEHPEVRAVVVTSGQPRVFCAGANIYMLSSSTHAFKVNFCKFTNETRLALEEACHESGQHYLAALNGVASGGGYELALACEHIMLCDDGSSAVSFPETPLLGVLPGTGGLTRLVDKRKVRRDLADVFSSLAEGVRGKRAKDWGLVDEVVPKSKFDEAVMVSASKLASMTEPRVGDGIKLDPVAPTQSSEGSAKRVTTFEYRHITMVIRDRMAELEVRGPQEAPPKGGKEHLARGADLWALRVFRELDHALLELRFNRPEVGLLVLRTKAGLLPVSTHDDALLDAMCDPHGGWFAHEVVLHMRRVLKRLELSAKSIFSIIEPGSAFDGSLFELAIASDRSFMRAGEERNAVSLSRMNFGPLPMSSGITRLQARFLGAPEHVAELSGDREPFDAERALAAGLVTFAPDDIDWEDEVRLAIEERLSLSPDALTGMEANLRFAGPETMETKIFARLSAWQNWIFQRPNAVGERGALTMYGRPERPEFDFKRT